MKKIGILGGIGPEASGYFYSEIIARLRSRGSIRSNTDYPQIYINSINAPELVTVEPTEDMLEPYAVGVRELASLKPEYIVMACNTIHLFREHLIERSGFKNISDISHVVSSAIPEQAGCLCVLGTPATVSSGLYTFEKQRYLNPSHTQLEEIGAVVVNYNATGETSANKDVLMRIIQDRTSAGAEIFIAGCTEISELLRGTPNIHLLDTLELLIEDTITRIQALD